MTPQAALTGREISRLPTRNQHGGRGLTVIHWRAVKGEAIDAGVRDWTAVADAELTYAENVGLMRERSTARGGGPTVRDMPASVRAARPR